MSRYNETEIKDIFTAELIETLKKENVDFSNRETEGTANQGYTEFMASIETKDEDGDPVTIEMYLYIDSDIVDETESLDQLDWSTAIENATFDYS